MDNSLKKIVITESQYKTLLNEMLSSVLYHFCGLYETYDMLKDNAFYLNSAYKNNSKSSDDMHNTKKFYMCFTRQVNSRQGYSSGKSVRIEFDGDLLNQRFEGRPVDYWGDSMGKQQYFRDTDYGGDSGQVSYIQKNTENEDRLFSNEPVIRDIKKYIKRIDILLPIRPDATELSVKAFNNIDSLKLAYRICGYFGKNRTFVYTNINDFDARNDKNITEWLTNQYDLYGEINSGFRFGDLEYEIFRLLNFLNYAEDVNMRNNKERKEAIANNAKMLKHYHLEQHLPYIMKMFKTYKDYEFVPKNIDVGNIFSTLRGLSKEDYVYMAKMFDDYYKSHGYNSHNDVIKRKEETFYRNRYGRGIDYEKTVKILCFKPNGQSDRYGNIMIPNPSKTSFWDIFENDQVDYKSYFIEDIMRNVRQHGSKDDESFYKYLQHLTKNNISVFQMLNILDKLKFDADFDVMDYVFGGSFKDIPITYMTYDDQKYINDSDKEQVKRMFYEE